jgi:hypothetical protein
MPRSWDEIRKSSKLTQEQIDAIDAEVAEEVARVKSSEAPTPLAPIHISLDLEVPGGAGYVRYRRLEKGAHVARTVSTDETHLVNIDFDADGAVLGVELVALDVDAYARAQEAGAEYNLIIPDLSRAVKTSGMAPS